MPKSGKVTVFMVVLIGLATLAFLGWHLSQAQIRVQGKPTPPCNNNSVCEHGEFNASYSFDTQPCWDCRNKGYLPLQMIENPGQQLAGHQCQIDRVFQIQYENGLYIEKWAGTAIGFVDYALIGDANKDGLKEIVAVGYNQYAVGSRKNVQYFYNLDIWMFKNGSTGQAASETLRTSYSSRSPSWAIMADANNDGFDDELIISRGHQVEIYRWDPNSNLFLRVWLSPDFQYGIRSLDCGDGDNDGFNELYLAHSYCGAFGVLEWMGGDIWGNYQLSESWDTSNLDDAKVRDADNDGLKEVIGGGSNNQLSVWKYTGGIYKKVFSQTFGDDTYADAGDVDGNGENEVIVSAGSANDGILYVFSLIFNAQSNTYSLVSRGSLSGVPCIGNLTLGNMDGDNRQEIFVASCHSTTVYDFNGTLQKTCDNAYGSFHPTVK